MAPLLNVQSVPGYQRAWRHFGAWVTNRLLPVTCVNADASMAATKALLADGYGLLAIMNHFSRRDPAQLLALLLGDRALSSRRLLAPVAFHQHSWIVQTLSDSLAVELTPVVTGHSKRRLKERTPRESGLEGYKARSIDTFRRGGIVLLAPQGRRRSLLGAPPFGRPMELLLGAALDAGVDRIALLFVSLSVPGATTYDRRVLGGANLFMRYEAHYALPITLRDAVEAAGGRGGLDAWTFARLAELAPAPYLAPQAAELAPQAPADPPAGGGRRAEAGDPLALGDDVDD